jgi:type II secretory pathway pseudopilin PulG
MKRSSEGFALVEAVVALGIVAAILGVTFQVVAMARGAMAAAEERRLAMLQAQSLMAQLGATIPLAPGTSSGEDGGLDWRVETFPVASREIHTPMMRAVVTVSDQRDHVLARLETLRLAQ